MKQVGLGGAMYKGIAGDQLVRRYCFAIYALAALVIVGRAKNYTYTGSFDLALHYDLVHSISKTWVWPASGKPLLSTMYLYPPLAHYMGAAAGLIVGSPLLGMFTVVTASMFGCYVLLTRALAAGSILSTAAAGIIAAAGLALGRSQHAVEGFQTIYNFFYAHMVGDFLFLAYAVWLSQTRLDWSWRLAMTAAATFGLGWLYLLTSIQVALTYVGLEGLLLVRGVIERKAIRIGDLIPMLLGVIILPLLVAFHPMFRLMADVAANDGALPLGSLEPYVPAISGVLVLTCLILGLLGPCDTPRWRKGSLFLAVAGLASGAAAVAQYMAFVLVKAGSAYAVKKYGFANLTLLIFAAAALVGALIDGRKVIPQRPIFKAVIACLAGAAALYFLPVSNTPDRVDKFTKYQRFVDRVLASPQLPAEARGNIVSKNTHFHVALNHAETMVDMAMAPNTSLVADMNGVGASEGNPATYAFVVDPVGAFPKPCIVPTSKRGDLSLAKLSCIQTWPLAAGSPILLTQMQFLPDSFVSGWSGNEGNGVWTLGKEAVFRLRLAHAPPTVRLTFSGPAFIPDKSYVQRVDAYVGDAPVGGHVFTAEKPDGQLTAVIPASMFKDGAVEVTLKMPDATSPAAQKTSGDGRVIAFFVTGVSLDK